MLLGKGSCITIEPGLRGRVDRLGNIVVERI